MQPIPTLTEGVCHESLTPIRRISCLFLTDELAKTGGSNVRMTHDQMARYMGSAREVVSRLLKYFAQEGWVRLYRGGVEVLDQQKLQEIARGQ